MIFFENLPGTRVKTNVTFNELCNEFQEQKKDNFAYIDPTKAIAYEIKENYTFYPVQNNSVTRQMSEHMPYYFQLHIEGF